MNDTNLSDILEIKPPMEVETGSSILWPVIILAVLFIIGAVLLIWAYRKPNRGGTPPAPDAEAHRRLRQAWVLLGEPVLFAEGTSADRTTRGLFRPLFLDPVGLTPPNTILCAGSPRKTG